MTINAFSNLAFDRAMPMKEMKQDRLAFDLQSARTYDKLNGHLHVSSTNLSKATINPYLGAEIPGHDELGLDPDREYRLLRHPDELKAAAASFNGKPLVLTHRAQAVDDNDHQNRVGSVGNVRFEAPYLVGDLAVWSREAIDAIESGSQKELSCGYGYTPDMTPGEFEGKPFDGVMRGLSGDHVALVREGRAGPDCHVFDSMESILMNGKKVSLTRTGTFAHGALLSRIKPMLATDAKAIDFKPLWKDVTKTNFKDQKARLAADIKRQLTGKLAKDADMSDVVELLDILEPMIEEAGPDVNFSKIDPVNGDPDPAAPDATDEDEDAALKAALKELGILDDDIAKVCAKAKGGAPAQDDAPANMGVAEGNAAEGDDTDASAGGGSTRTYAPTDNGGMNSAPGLDEKDDDKDDKDKDKKAMDERLKGMVSKTAMDAALKQAVDSATAAATARVHAIHDAKEHASAWVGKLPGAFDSAENVYRTALKALDVPNADKLHPDALRPILDAQPKPGDRPRNLVASLVAQDAKTQSEYETMFPNANRLKN